MNLTERIERLPVRSRKGSRLRCILFTEGARPDVARRLTLLGAPYAAIDPIKHRWLPNGLDHPAEAKLGETLDLLSSEQRKTVTAWWLAVTDGANTPNWDIASTADIDGREGLLLVEAKAHAAELKMDGKPQDGNAKNHERICDALKLATGALNDIRTGWTLSAASCYQLANRFAWAWKVASLGVPVVLIYLGFLDAAEMRDLGAPLADAQSWERLVKDHARGLAPESVWGDTLLVDRTPLRAFIRSMRLDIPSRNIT